MAYHLAFQADEIKIQSLELKRRQSIPGGSFLCWREGCSEFGDRLVGEVSNELNGWAVLNQYGERYLRFAEVSAFDASRVVFRKVG
jgi:hypothetical protein